MMYTAALTLAAMAVGVSAQGAAIGIAPAGGSPAGCLTTKDGNYEITVVQTPEDAAANPKSKRQALPSCGGPDALVFTVKGGILTDRSGRIGSIVANRQFQFDGPPPQTGAIYTGGFSICPNSSLAIGPTTNFYQCKSGNFYNLYDQPSESACMLVKFNTIQCQLDGETAAASASVSAASVSAAPVSSSSAVVSQSTDGQPTASSAVVSQKTDGQPTASSATTAIVSQISDGQPQATTPSNATVTTAKPTLATGAAAQLIGSGAIAMVGAAAALFL